MIVRMPASYDNWVTSGYSHRCVCGSIWYDSDGGACHEECRKCGSIVDAGDLDDQEMCEACFLEEQEALKALELEEEKGDEGFYNVPEL